MIFSIAQVTNVFSSQSRKTAELVSPTPESRKVTSANQNQTCQRTVAASGMFGLLVSNSAPQGRWF